MIGDVNGDGMRDVIAGAGVHLNVMINQSAQPAGLSTYGAGKPSCRGVVGVSAVAPIAINTTAQFTSTNAPKNALGSARATDTIDAAGSDYFAIGVPIHLGLVTFTEFYFSDFYSDGIGTSLGPEPVPNDLSLVGKTYYLQVFWLAPANDLCDPSPLGLIVSRGLAIVVQ